MIVYAQHALDETCTWARPENQILEFVPDVELRRRVAQFTLKANTPQQNCLLETPAFRATGGQFYACAWWRFPVGYTHNGAPSFPGREHKLFCISVEDPKGKGRVLVNAQGQSGNLRAYVEGFDSDPRGALLLDTDAPIPLDGLWHSVEVLIGRIPTGLGHVELWLDGKKVGERGGATGSSPFVSAQIGAYVNQGSDVRKSFQVRDLLCSDGRPAVAQQANPPQATPGTTHPELERIANDLESLGSDLAANMAALARRLRGVRP